PLGTPAALETTALVHLLDMAHRFRALPRFRGPDKHRPERLQRQTRAEVVKPAAVTHDPGLARQVALLADGLAQGPLQVAGVDDGVVHPGRDRLQLLPAGDV